MFILIMSYTPGFSKNVRSNFTFQSNIQRCPLPQPPPPPVTPFMFTPQLSDQEFVKKFEKRIRKDSVNKHKAPKTSIAQLHDKLYMSIQSLCNIKAEEEKLHKNIDSISDKEWESSFVTININKNIISNTLSDISSSYLELCKRNLTKRTAKRLRQQRLRENRKTENRERKKQSEEKSRKIDENLQKIQNDIRRAKQEEEAKIQADLILKEVIRKKLEAKKCVAKLEALLKLRNARQNTAKGRGQPVSDTDAAAFKTKIEQILKLWEHKLESYEKEEADSRLQLEKNHIEKHDSNTKECDVTENLEKWQEALFGGKEYPQVDFQGRVADFVAVRAQWDRHIDNSAESTPIPVGWVVPSSKDLSL